MCHFKLFIQNCTFVRRIVDVVWTIWFASGVDCAVNTTYCARVPMALIPKQCHECKCNSNGPKRVPSPADHWGKVSQSNGTARVSFASTNMWLPTRCGLITALTSRIINRGVCFTIRGGCSPQFKKIAMGLASTHHNVAHGSWSRRFPMAWAAQTALCNSWISLLLRCSHISVFWSQRWVRVRPKPHLWHMGTEGPKFFWSF